MTTAPDDELKELTIDSIDGLLTVLDVMAGEPPEGFDFDEHIRQQKKRGERIGELTHMILNRDAILAADDLVKELVHCPEWGGDVYVRCLTGAERDAFESSVVQQRGKQQSVNLQNVRAKLAAASICDENGKRLFSDADVKALSAKSAAPLNRIFAVAQRLSGLTESDVEELTEALEADPFGGLPTA